MPCRCRHPVPLAVLLALAAPHVGAAAERIEVARYPYLPALEVSERHEICGRFLDNLTEQFKSERFDFDFGWNARASESTENGPVDYPEINWRKIEPDAPDPDFPYSVIAYDADIDGDGDLDLLVEWHRTLSSSDYFEIFAFDDRADVLAKARAIRGLQDREQFHSYIGKAGNRVASGWAAPHIFVLDGEHFVFTPGPWVPDAGPLAITRIELDGPVTEICRVRFYPEAWTPENRNGEYRAVGAPANLPPGLGHFLRSLRPMLGPGSGCGRAVGIHRMIVASRIRTTLLRPWVFSLPTTHRIPTARSKSLIYLEDWAHTGLWEYRAYRALIEAQEAAIDDLAGWYAAKFGIHEATAHPLAIMLLTAIVDDAVAGFPYYYADAEKSTDWREALRRRDDGKPINPVELHFHFLQALAEGAHVRAVTRLIDSGADIEGPVGLLRFELIAYPRPRMAASSRTRETPLFLTLEHPSLVELLLEHGADVNHANYFGKTPLMYAAQFGLHETAEILLRHGADPNLRTTQFPSGCDRLRYTERTALMYAAENADARMMAVLVAAGAATDVRDRDDYSSGKTGRSLSDYLALNEELTDAEREAIIERWRLE